MKELVKKAGLASQFQIESAATSREEIGNPVYPPVRRKLAEHGISCDCHAARQLTNQDYDKYDLLIGMDRVKSLDVLLPAYDDAEGVTAAFNLNLLHRVNRQLGCTIPVDAFKHEARWNEPRTRIEMHLVARRDVEFLLGEERISLGKGESIHTENSHKYRFEEARMLLRCGGWEPINAWSDPLEHFTLFLARRDI